MCGSLEIAMTNGVFVSDLSYAWPGQGYSCLDGVGFSVAPGEKVFIEGASGSGKSTLLKLLAGILRPQQGSIRIHGTDIHLLGARACDHFRARHIGLIFQQFNLIPWLDVATNLQLAASFGDTRASNSRITELLQGMNLDPALATRKAGELSVGQQQRVAIARALINRPGLLIADEPTSALDADSQEAFLQLLLKAQQESGVTVLFVSHDARLSSHFDRILGMKQLQRAQSASEVVDVV
jgi:putative ABC transport system ATP-binding protein